MGLFGRKQQSDNSWADAIKAVAPTVAAGLLGPAGGVAANVLLKSMNIPKEATIDAIDQIRSLVTGQDSADSLLKIKQAEQDYQIRMRELDIQVDKMQADINLQEAKHDSIWVSGWRPACGWVTATAMGYHFLVYPLLGSILLLYGIDLIDLDWQELSVIAATLLGNSALRTVERHNNVHRTSMKG